MAGTITTSTIQNDTSNPPTFRNNSVEIGTLCRAWVNFNGTGTPAIRGSFNVSSITDNGQGDFTVNFTNAMPDALYATVAACSTADSQVETVLNINSQTSGAPVSPTTTATRMVISKSGVGRKDPEFVCVSIFR